MDNNQNNWEKLKNITNEYEPNPDLANDVITKLNQRESTVKFKSKTPIWVIVAICFVLIVGIILVFCLNNNNGPALYLSDNDLEISEVENMKSFVEENQLDIYYVETSKCHNQSAIVKESRKVAYIEQTFLYIGFASFEQIDLKIVLVDAIYDFSENFGYADKSLNVSDINIEYKISNNNLYALFKSEKVKYYIEISDTTGNEETLKGVVDLLISS